MLFDVKHATVSEHISNILASGELDETSVGFSDKSTGGRKPKIYNSDMILSVGYRVNSKRGIVEEKAANLLYFMIKDHPYADGCKRIAASLFLEFLDKNNVLFLNNTKRFSDGTLVAITLMIAESKPEEKDIMIKLVMNLMNL